ncbi:MAG TPA: class II glutamine amidotransferase [Candidatus Paceibacterota bacterium]|nr:class II glutamine amidotransferase [Candidatus Paceibacterota bacterium]
MCGILLGLNINNNKDFVNEDVINIYQDQYARGQEGFGMMVINDDFTYKVLRSTEPLKFLFDMYNYKSKMIIAHHRRPTSSENKISQTHPIQVSHASLDFDWFLFHNGMITNHKERKAKHEEYLKIKYSTERTRSENYNATVKEHNDSEALAIDLARYLEGHTKEIKTEGYAAFIMVKTHKISKKVERIYYGTDLNPLKMAKNRNIIRISSEGPGNEVKKDIIYNFDLKKFKVTKIPLIKPKRKVAITYNQNGWNRTTVTGFEDTTSNKQVELFPDDKPEEEYNKNETTDKLQKILRTRFKRNNEANKFEAEGWVDDFFDELNDVETVIQIENIDKFIVKSAEDFISFLKDSVKTSKETFQEFITDISNEKLNNTTIDQMEKDIKDEDELDLEDEGVNGLSLQNPSHKKSNSCAWCGITLKTETERNFEVCSSCKEKENNIRTVVEKNKKDDETIEERLSKLPTLFSEDGIANTFCHKCHRPLNEVEIRENKCLICEYGICPVCQTEMDEEERASGNCKICLERQYSELDRQKQSIKVKKTNIITLANEATDIITNPWKCCPICDRILTKLEQRYGKCNDCHSIVNEKNYKLIQKPMNKLYSR